MSTVPSSPAEAAQRSAFQSDAEPKADSPAKPQTQEKHVTAYVVVRLNGTNSWQVVTTTTAGSAKAAIQKVVDAAAEKDKTGTYVAVPERSWQPVTVKVETQTVIKFD